MEDSNVSASSLEWGSKANPCWRDRSCTGHYIRNPLWPVIYSSCIGTSRCFSRPIFPAAVVLNFRPGFWVARQSFSNREEVMVLVAFHRRWNRGRGRVAKDLAYSLDGPFD